MWEVDFPFFDPVFLPIPWLPLDLRWYGLMYVVGFVVGQYILKRLSRAGFFPVEPERITDLIFMLIFGVILGGRLGYFIFYEEDRFDPWFKVFKIWEGGLSFHGGLLGVVIATWWFSIRNKISLRRVWDSCSIAVTPGILAVRMANFINGELFGRKCGEDALIGMRSPTDPAARHMMNLNALGDKRAQELGIQYAYHRDEDSKQALVDAITPERFDQVAASLNWAEVKEHVPLRHPSQLYEGALEGLVLGLVLWFLYRRFGQRFSGGVYSAIFLWGYGAGRFVVEFFRQPDEQFRDGQDKLGVVLGPFSMGQVLCFVMILCGFVMFFLREKKGPAADGGPSADGRPAVDGGPSADGASTRDEGSAKDG